MIEKQGEKQLTHEFLYGLIFKLNDVLETLQKEYETISSEYQAKISHLQHLLRQKSKQVDSMKKNENKEKNSEQGPIKILLKYNPKVQQKKSDLCITDRDQIKIKTQNVTHLTTPKGQLKQRPSIFYNSDKKVLLSEKKSYRNSSSEIKNRLLQRQSLKTSESQEKFQQLAHFSHTLLKSMNKDVDKGYLGEEARSFLNSPRLTMHHYKSVRDDKKETTEIKVRNTQLPKRQRINEREKQNSGPIVVKKLQRKSNSRKNLFKKKGKSAGRIDCILEHNSTKKNIAQQYNVKRCGPDHHANKKCIDVTIPIKIINVPQIEKRT